MFSMLAIVSSLAILAVATPTPNEPASSCTTGSLECCSSSGSSSDPTIAKELGALGVVVQGVDVLVGLTCSPITVVGVSGSSCSAQSLCCDKTGASGLVAIGCTPVDL